MKIKRKGLFKEIWRVWLTDPNWKVCRRYMWMAVIVNLICFFVQIFFGSPILSVINLALVFGVMAFNFEHYVQKIELNFELALMQIGIEEMEKEEVLEDE